MQFKGFMYLSKTEEIIVIVVGVFILIAFIINTAQNIRQTISEEKEKEKIKKRNEGKIRTLIKYMETKKAFMRQINKQNKN